MFLDYCGEKNVDVSPCFGKGIVIEDDCQVIVTKRAYGKEYPFDTDFKDMEKYIKWQASFLADFHKASAEYCTKYPERAAKYD